MANDARSDGKRIDNAAIALAAVACCALLGASLIISLGHEGLYAAGLINVACICATGICSVIGGTYAARQVIAATTAQQGAAPAVAPAHVERLLELVSRLAPPPPHEHHFAAVPGEDLAGK